MTSQAWTPAPLPNDPRFMDLTGQTFGRLTVAAYAGRDGLRKNYWKCVCACGCATVAQTSNLRAGNVRSCGCIRQEAAVRASASRWATPKRKTPTEKETT